MKSAWFVVAIALLPPLLAATLASGIGAVGSRLIAIELVSSVAVILLIALSFVFDQPSSIDLALMLVLLTLPGTLIFALFQERWL